MDIEYYTIKIQKKKIKTGLGIVGLMMAMVLLLHLPNYASHEMYTNIRSTCDQQVQQYQGFMTKDYTVYCFVDDSTKVKMVGLNELKGFIIINAERLDDILKEIDFLHTD